ncbi:MAG TPA: hypothetical protein VNG51_23905 [Ktedonobacteraceae bacterium]|nr:hypothetical protein [Ktedonobacteraceae bacterium]
MATMQKWDTLTVEMGFFGMNSDHPAPRFVNGVEIKDWKKVPLHAFITQLGADGWEMSGTINISGTSSGNFLFFKRPRP